MARTLVTLSLTCLLLFIQSEASDRADLRRALKVLEGLDEHEQKRLIEDLMELPGKLDDLSKIPDQIDNLLKLKDQIGDIIPDSLIPDKLNFLKCKKEGEGCRGLPKCCGDTQCYWKKGFSLLKDGVCVQCINETQFCQRDASCCDDMMCDRGSSPLFNVDGVCRMPRTEGEECYRNKQCKSLDCKKRWWQISGTCNKVKD